MRRLRQARYRRKNTAPRLRIRRRPPLTLLPRIRRRRSQRGAKRGGDAVIFLAAARATKRSPPALLRKRWRAEPDRRPFLAAAPPAETPATSGRGSLAPATSTRFCFR